MAQGKNNKTRFSNKSNLKNAAVTVATIVGPGKFVKAAQIVKKAAKTAKAAKAAKAAAKTTKNLPKGPTVKNPPKPSGGSPFNPNPPKPPTGLSRPKPSPHVSENRTPSYKLPEALKSVTKKNPTKNRGPFSGNMDPYNFTGK